MMSGLPTCFADPMPFGLPVCCKASSGDTAPNGADTKYQTSAVDRMRQVTFFVINYSLWLCTYKT